MAINALIAQGLAPIGRDIPDIVAMQQRNSLAQRSAAIDEQNAANYQNSLAQQDQARSAAASEARRKQALEWAANAVDTVRQNPALIPQFIAQGKQQGILPPETPDQATPEQVEQFAMRLGIAPKAKPEPITAQTIGGFRVLMQGGKPVSGGVQAPERPQAATPVKPNWTKVDQRMPDGTVQSGVIDMNAPDPTATFKAMGAPGKAGADESRTFARADKLRDEFNAASKELVTVGDNYAKIREVSADNSAAGDLSLIFSYMKMLDPNSVVREQEFANAQNAAGVPDRIRAAYNKVISGERLSQNQRADFIKQAGNVYNAQKKRHESTVVKRYTAMAKRWNIDPQDVIGDLSVTLPNSGGGSASSAGGVPADVDAILKKYSK